MAANFREYLASVVSFSGRLSNHKTSGRLGTHKKIFGSAALGGTNADGRIQEQGNNSTMATESLHDRQMIRHTVATLVYRATKTFAKVPAGFDAFRAKSTSRTPAEIVAHMGDLFDWALSLARGNEVWHDSPPQEWQREVDRWFAAVREFDTYLANSPTIACPMERLFQGPIADALTHVGQLAMLRNLFGAPIRGENYFRADISVGRVGPDQAAPRREFD